MKHVASFEASSEIAGEVLFLCLVIKSVIKILYLHLKSYINYASMAVFKYNFSLVYYWFFSWGWYSPMDVQSHSINVCKFLEYEVSLEQACMCVCGRVYLCIEVSHMYKEIRTGLCHGEA